ncbi:MAG: hypothetical protein ACI4OZ_05200 [Akkermansia sp.]
MSDETTEPAEGDETTEFDLTDDDPFAPAQRVADYTPEGPTCFYKVPEVEDRPGCINAVVHDTEAEEPYVEDGRVVLPVADSRLGVLGAVRSVEVEYGSESRDNYIDAGKLHLSIPTSGGSGGGSQSGGGGSQSGGGGTTGGGSCTCPSYEFDAEWFTVTVKSDGTQVVSLRAEALDALAAEVVSELEVEVSASGIAEATTHGNIRVASAGSGSVAALAVETNVSLG